MKLKVILFSLLAVTLTGSFTACEKEVIKEVIVNPTQPQGTFTADKNGTFTEQNGTGSKGTAQLGTDSKGNHFLKFGSDFNSNFGTGTLTVYLSTSSNYTADPANGNPYLRLIGPVTKAGENYFLLDPAADPKFTHVILWCGSASIPFGYAPIN